MIKISRLADYGTVILSHLANYKDQRLSATQVADATRLPMPTVSKLLKILNEAELVTSTRGPNGGYELARLPSEISLAEVISAIDGELAMTECSKSPENCELTSTCGLRHNWQYINYMIVEMLSQLSLADMNQPLNKMIKIETLGAP
jgi:FeS assembly SUF system regulator